MQSAPLTTPLDFHLPSSRDSGFSFTSTTTTATYDVPFSSETPEPFPAASQDPLQNRIIEEVNEEFPGAGVGAECDEGPLEEVEMCQDGEPEKASCLQRPAPHTRQRSLTLPSHFGASQA